MPDTVQGSAVPPSPWVPIPDPTALTTALVDKKAVDLRRDQDNLKELLLEKIAGLQAQLFERDHRRTNDLTMVDARLAAALQAQKDLVGAHTTHMNQAIARIETTGTRQIEQVTTLLHTTNGATNEKVDDLKERVTLIEGRTAGITTATTAAAQQATAGQQTSSYHLALIAALITAVGILVSILLRH